MTDEGSVCELARGLRFDAEIQKNVHPSRYPAWLPRAMRLRYYVSALAAWLAVGAVFGAGAIWWVVLFALFAFHWAAHRAVRRRDYLRELDLLREICGDGGSPITSYYRRERSDAINANPSPDRERTYGKYRLSDTEPVFHMRKMHARRILRQFSHPNLNAADVGCLAGDVSEEHVRAGHSVFLFDLDLDSLRLALERTGRPAVQADVETLPVRSGSFELLTFFEVVEHLADPLGAMRKLADTLAPGGRMVMSTDNAGCLLAFHLLNPLIVFERIAGIYFPSLLPHRNLVKIDEPTGKIFPHASFTSAQILSLIEEAGLKLLWLKSYYFLPGFHWPLSRFFPSWTADDYVRFALPVEAALQKIPIVSRLGVHWVLACEKPAEE